MKLLRVVSKSGDLTRLFHNQFSEPITIKPNSKIALLNGTFSMSSKNIQVPDCTMTFQVKAGGHTFTVNLPAGNYSQQSLCDTLTRLINVNYFTDTGVGNDNIQDSLAFQVENSSNGKVSINFAKSAIQAQDTAQFDMTLMELDLDSLKAQGPNGSASGQFNSFAITQDVCLSHGFNTINVDTFDSSSNPTSGVQYIAGLLRSIPAGGENLSATHIKYGYRVDSAEVFTIVDGVETGQTGSVQSWVGVNGDDLDVQFSNGKMIFKKSDTVL